MATTQGKYKNLYAFAVLRADGKVISWGHSSYGGDSSSQANQLTSVKNIYSNYGAFAAVKTDGSVVTWGSSIYGGTASVAYYNGSYTYTSVADKLTSGVKSITSNSNAFAALKTDGTVVTWGDAKAGGDASLVTYNKGFIYTSIADQLTYVSNLYSNDGAFVALRKDGSVVTWGSSDSGGDSSSVSSKLFKVKAIYATKQDFAALKADGTVVTWGSSPAADSSAVTAKLVNIKQVYANDFAFVALKKNGSLVTWGAANSGGDSSSVSSQLTSVKEVYATKSAFAALKTDGSVITWGDKNKGGNSNDVSASLTNVQSIYANNHAFAALKADGSVVTWGDAYYGGDSSSVSSKLVGVKAIYATDTAFAALKLDGTVVTWGNLAGGGDSNAVTNQLTGVVEIFATGNDSSSAFAALKSDGSVVTWGDAYYGGNSSSVAVALNGSIDVLKFNDQIGSVPMSPTSGSKIVGVFDADESLGLYQLSTGKYVLAPAGLEVGSMPSMNIFLKDQKGIAWQPSLGEFITAIDKNNSTTEVIISKGGTTTTYSRWIFDNNTGNAIQAKATPMTFLDILSKESAIQQDINGDGAVGDVVMQVFDTSNSWGLYKMSSGSYILSEIGLEVGDQPSSFTKLMLSKTAQWTPTINDSVIAIEDVAKGIELVTATTIKTKVTYSKMFFDTLSGVAGKKLVPDNLQLSRYEETLSKDLNGDGLIANLRVQMGNSVYDLVLKPDAWVTAKALADKSTYFDADSNSTIKGSLLSINSQEELDNVMEFVTPFLSKLTAKAGIDGNSIPYLWTSATDAVKEAIWLWSDNTPISLTDTHWNEKPETYTLNKQDYLGVALTNSADGSILAGQWNDLLGTNKLAYIIEYTLA